MKKSIKAFFVSLFLILTVSGSFAAETTNKPEMKLPAAERRGASFGSRADAFSMCGIAANSVSR